MEYKQYIEFQFKRKNNPAYFRALVFSKRADMESFYFFACKEYGIKLDKDPKNEEFYACVFPFDITKPGMSPDCLGVALFCKKFLSTATITHELLHAALWYDRIIGKNKTASYGRVIGSKEEVLCDILGELTSSFYMKLKEANKANKEDLTKEGQ